MGGRCVSVWQAIVSAKWHNDDGNLDPCLVLWPFSLRFRVCRFQYWIRAAWYPCGFSHFGIGSHQEYKEQSSLNLALEGNIKMSVGDFVLFLMLRFNLHN